MPFVRRVVVANPLQVRSFAWAKVKTDKIDALEHDRIAVEPRSFSITWAASCCAATMSSLAWIALSIAAISRTLVEETWLKISGTYARRGG